MTISSSNRKAGPFIGNDTTTQLPFEFKVFRKEDLYVVLRDDVSEVETQLVQGVDFSVSLNADQNDNPGGTVVLTAPLAMGKRVVVTSLLRYLQPTELTNQGGFYPRVISDALDRLTIFVQQLDEQVQRSVKVDISDIRTPTDYWQDLFVVAKQKADSAAASAQAALSSEQAAAQSAANALASGQAAGVSETNALASEQAAAQSAANALVSEQSADLSETNAAASSTAAQNAEIGASNSALSASMDALLAQNAAQAAVEPVAAVVAQYLDNFIPTGQIVPFSTIYTPGGFDFGTLDAATPFPNEDAALRRASLSAGSGTFDYGLLA